MASAEELAQLIEQTVRAVLAGMQGAGAPQGQTGGGGNRRILEPKGISRVDIFSGKEAQWREWAFQFRVAIKAMEGRVAEIMAKGEQSEKGLVLSDLELEYVGLDVTKVAGELYDLLCLRLKGDLLILA